MYEYSYRMYKKTYCPLYLGRQLHLFPVIGFWRIFDILMFKNRMPKKACVAIFPRFYHIFN